MTRKKYILNFTVDDNTIPVPFDVYIGGQDASEIDVITDWTETQRDISFTPQLSADNWYTVNGTVSFDAPIKSFITIPSVSDLKESFPDLTVEIDDTNNKALRVHWSGSTNNTISFLKMTVTYDLPTIEDRLNWLKTHKTA